MIVVVCGGRDYVDSVAISNRLAQLPKHAIVITGGARGADALAAREAMALGLHTATMPALWNVHGKAAGFLRNQAMLTLAPELVIAFPGGAGTRDCCRRAEQLQIEVERVDWP